MKENFVKQNLGFPRFGKTASEASVRNRRCLKEGGRGKPCERGFAAFFTTILIFAVVFAISSSIFILTYGEQKIIQNVIKSSQAYYAAEAGIEDALLRLAKPLNWANSYKLNVGTSWATTTISNLVGGSRTITSQGDSLGRIRKIQAVYAISAQEVSFYYGAQVGEGGIIMQDTSKIEGNVFSNGSVINLDGIPKITGTVKVAKTGNRLEGMQIGADAYVDICQNSKISGTLTYRKKINCKASVFKDLTQEIATTSLPISEEQINQWKKEAVLGGVITGDYILKGKQEAFLGPQKIEGKMTIQDRAKLFVTGTIWVTGEIVLENNAEMRLNQDSYSSLSGVVIADRKIIVQDEAVVSGTSRQGSYLMLLSTLDSVATGDVAMVVQNSPELDIIYASRGKIQLQDSIELREVSGWGLELQNKASVIYETGLKDTTFISGPAGSWEVTSWGEIE